MFFSGSFWFPRTKVEQSGNQSAISSASRCIPNCRKLKAVVPKEAAWHDVGVEELRGLELLDLSFHPWKEVGQKWEGYFVVELFVCLCCCFFVFSVEVLVIFEWWENVSGKKYLEISGVVFNRMHKLEFKSFECNIAVSRLGGFKYLGGRFQVWQVR